VVSSGAPQADVVCQGTSQYRQAERLANQRGAPFQPLDSPPWWETVFTSMFMHGGILHIAFNMLFLWIFGNNIEDSMGRPRFLLFYLAAGIVAAYAQALLDTNATEPAIGASGAIAGVLGGYLLLYPRARVLTLVFIIFFVTLIEIPAVIMLGSGSCSSSCRRSGSWRRRTCRQPEAARLLRPHRRVPLRPCGDQLFANRYRSIDPEQSAY
jgi:membrane associated rhomboid family serine protease